MEEPFAFAAVDQIGGGSCLGHVKILLMSGSLMLLLVLQSKSPLFLFPLSCAWRRLFLTLNKLGCLALGVSCS